MTDVEVAICVVEAGAAVVRASFGHASERIDKDAGDFATRADIEAEEAMLAVLRHERPRDGVVGEETGQRGSADGTRRWLLDPLCGTLNYAVRMRVAAVNAALVDGERCLAAAVADPFTDDVLWTDMSGSFIRTQTGMTPLSPDPSSVLVDVNLDPPFPNGHHFRAVDLLRADAFTATFRPRVVSTSMALAWVATGQRAAYVTDGDLRSSVHFAAGIALCEAAGCVVTDLWGRPWRRGGYGLLAASDRQTHQQLLRIVGTLTKDTHGA